MNFRLIPFLGFLALTSCDRGKEATHEEPTLPNLEPPAPGLKLERSTEEEAVFRRAFWRRPGPDDEILHAERREWVDGETEVRHWQWFLALRPGKELTRWFDEENPFSVSEIKEDSLTADDWIADAPSWMPGLEQIDGMTIQRSRTSRLTFLSPPDENILYAFDVGRGFTGTP